MAQGAWIAAPRMTPHVIDTSAILAIIFGEPGLEKAARLARGGIISSVTLAEIVSKCAERSVPVQIALDYVRHSNVEVAGFSQDLAILAGQLYAKAPKGRLSLGDRACIATAVRLGGIAVTADRIWADLDIDCKIELIR
ncbi:type II toxin-antitoxin system VapC family toxin [Chelativorans sp. AA-79]|uniref:PIN domain-containing protein n=1 Tax=Chelativorans sp. AA-79 TaxID=3028735 RepID=UPI0023F822CA|nr:type II toxin-antitoxin system VapC family toxin [Chelativorans sp. AA-79]WEX07693.1 type II toxin-antitoxin system VapC family toxin [Chelativorans sp. AA-79]